MRNSIPTGIKSEPIMAAIRSMALIAETSLWKLLRCVGSDKHILDILPEMWDKVLKFYEDAAGLLPMRSPSYMAHTH